MKKKELTKLNNCLTNFLRDILQNMMGYVTLKSIMDKIVRDHSAAQLADFKSIIVTMFETYNFERNILETAKHLFDGDKFNAVDDMKKIKASGIRQKPGACSLCQFPFSPHNLKFVFILFQLNYCDSK